MPLQRLQRRRRMTTPSRSPAAPHHHSLFHHHLLLLLLLLLHLLGDTRWNGGAGRARGMRASQCPSPAWCLWWGGACLWALLRRPLRPMRLRRREGGGGEEAISRLHCLYQGSIGTIKARLALSRLYQGSIKALSRLYQGSIRIKAPLRLY